MITPIELHNKQHKAGRGYKKKEMDLFLDEVFENYEQLYKENVELKDKISRLSDGVQQYKTMETALQKALVLAEKTSKDTIESASHKAAVIEKEARLKANTIVNDALSKSEEIKKQCILLLKQYNQFKAQYKQIALKQIELLDGDFYEIYSKDLIDALNEASEGNVADDNVFEDENMSDHEDISDDENVTEHGNVSEDKTVSADESAPQKNVSEHENIAEKNNMTEYENVSESGNIFMNEGVSGKENEVSLSNHIERAVKLSSDMTEHKEGTDAEISVPSGDTKEFTPLETKAIGRESQKIQERSDMWENIRIRESDRIQKNSEIRENNGIQKSSEIRESDRIQKNRKIQENNGIQKNSGMQDDDDEKLDRSIRKLRSQLADDRKAANPGSSFEFFDN